MAIISELIRVWIRCPIEEVAFLTYWLKRKIFE